MLQSAYHHLNDTLHTLLEENKLSGEQRELVRRHLQGALHLQAELWDTVGSSCNATPTGAS